MEKITDPKRKELFKRIELDLKLDLEIESLEAGIMPDDRFPSEFGYVNKIEEKPPAPVENKSPELTKRENELAQVNADIVRINLGSEAGIWEQVKRKLRMGEISKKKKEMARLKKEIDRLKGINN